ncbi:BnaA09g16000D [Brassica napus]|uniref:BnaA09g16000D protein n=1 Tax=Brassica napus TaxID=3708 RepID=A0A078D1E7_BRANA|nr:BnaA09g16000D [Brassica napus]
MLQRDWDPGIGEVLSDHWDSESRFGDGILHDRNVADGRLDFPSDFRTAGLIEGETMIEIWIWRKQGSMKFGSLIFISIIFKTKLNQGREVHGMQEDQVDLEDEDVMDMDEIKAHLLENGIDMDAEDFLEETAEEETEEVIKEQAEDNNAHVTDGGTVEEEQGPVAGNAEKKPGLRKRLFKASTGTAGSSKLRAFNALASPRKRAAAKPGVRPGDTIKQAESKGASNLKLGTQKI